MAVVSSEPEIKAIFKKLKSQDTENNKCFDCALPNPPWASAPLGIYLCEDCSSTHRNLGVHISFVRSTRLDFWKMNELWAMKVGGNSSAKKFWTSNGGTAALKNPDKTARYYLPRVVEKYRAELKERAAADAAIYPHFFEEIIEKATVEPPTPVGNHNDEFFTSMEASSIKRPTPPASRTATPVGVGRTPSPFLNAGKSNGNGSGIARTPSPLVNVAGAAPAASRTTSSAALRKGGVGAGPRKANVLGAKKTKLGAKKITGEVIDFEAAERKAKEEAERIEKLGYDPDAEEAAKKSPVTAKSVDLPNIASPTPVSPGRAGYGSSQNRERTNSDVERLGMGMGRLGFGQVGGGKPAPAPKKMGGFGSMGPNKATKEDDDEKYARQKFGAQKGISSDEFFNKGAFDPKAQSEAKTRLQGFEGASAISSNAYFGRPEEEDPGEEYGDLETAAKDFVRKFGVTAGDDLDNLTQVLGEGAGKLQSAIRSYLNG